VRQRERGAPADKIQVIQAKLESEAEQDKEAYDALGCWCQENLAAKQQAAEGMDVQVNGLSHDIEAQSAENARLNMELTSHQKELDDSQESLNQAKSMREEAANKFASDHQATTQYVNQLDDALTAVNRPENRLSLVSNMRSMLRAAGSDGLFLQLQKKTGGSTSPDVVAGVIKQMRSTFAEDLQDMEADESASAERHEDLAKAKAQEIGAIKRQIATKKQLAAAGGMQVARQKELVDRLSTLRDANAGLLASVKSLCDASEGAFQGRQDERQAELVALSSAQSAIAGAQFLALEGGRRQGGRAGHFGDGGAEELCLAAMGIANKTWKAAAQAACEKARAGQTQDAADATEALEGAISAAQRAAESDAELCREAQKEAAAEHERASESLDTQSNSVGSDKQSAESQIDDVTQQSASADKAKATLVELRAKQRKVLQGMRFPAGLFPELLKHMPQVAVPKLQEAAQHSEKLAKAAEAYDSRAEADAQKVSHNVDVTMSASAKVLITLRLIRADAEEAAISIKRERGVQAALTNRGPASCDAAALTAKAQQMGDILKKLSDAAEGLAFSALR
jgi:hypothetical protein